MVLSFFLSFFLFERVRVFFFTHDDNIKQNGYKRVVNVRSRSEFVCVSVYVGSFHGSGRWRLPVTAVLGDSPCRTIPSCTFALVCQLRVFPLRDWLSAAPRLPLSLHAHAPPPNNDNNDQDGYYRILLAVANHHFHGRGQNCDFVLFKFPVGDGSGAGSRTLWIKPG